MTVRWLGIAETIRENNMMSVEMLAKLFKRGEWFGEAKDFCQPMWRKIADPFAEDF